MAIRQFVLQGLPTTRIRASAAALFWMACPCPVKILPLIPRRSPLSIPAFRGTLPTSKDQLGAGKTFVDIASRADVLEQRKSTVFEFHDHAFQGLHSGLDLDQVEGDRLIRAEKTAGGDAEKQRIADLTGGTGYGHADGGFVIHNWNYL